MKRKIFALCIVSILILSFVGCAKNTNKTTETQTNLEETSAENILNSYPMTVLDSMGRSITFESMPERIVSTVPSNTEIIYAVGKGNNLVGDSVYCNYPEEALAVAKIGDYNGPNLELIIGLKPDVVFSAWLGDDVLTQLESAGIKVVLINPGNLEQIYDSISLIGNIVGAESETLTLISDMKIKQEEIIQKVKGYSPKSVFFEVWNDPLMSAGPGSFINELITLSNGINIAGDAESAYPEYSLETLISKNPQVYITADDGFKTAEDIFTREGYENIEAIKTGQLFMLHQDIISRPSPRIIDGLELVSRAIHPEAFDDK